MGAALIVTGTVVLTPEAKQPLEVKAASIAVEGPSTPDYPLQKKRHSVEFLRTIQHLRPRTNLFSAAFRVRSVAAHAIHCFFQDRGFVYVHTPIITASDCEGAGEMFQVTTLDLENVPKNADGTVDYTQDFFGKRANLTVSGQLNAENFAMAFGDVYTFGPTFRAENSNTQRHAAEFWMIEPEMAFCDLKGDMDVAEAMIKYVIRTVMDKCPDEIELLQLLCGQGPEGAAGARGLLRLRPGDLHRGGGDPGEEQRQVRLQGVLGLRPADRARALPHRAGVQEARCSSPTTPRRSRPSICASTTTARPWPPPTAWCPASARSSAAPSARSGWTCWRAASRSWAWTRGLLVVLDLRRYGSCRHAGFGLGFERMVMYLTGVSNIRDVLPHPRTVGSADF